MKHRGERATGRINVGAWMMSYADMATVLLAMFIVLSTLSKDQTGVSLYNGTQSFFNATSSFGLPGLSTSSSQPLPANNPTPSYLYHPRAEEETDERYTSASEDRSVRDDDEEQLQGFLEELQRQFPVERLRGQASQVVIDLYEPLHKEAPLLDERHEKVFEQLRPLLERETFRLYLIVWPPTPSPSSWLRAAQQARQIAGEFAALAHLQPAAAARLIPLAQPWRYRNIRRPVLSLLIVQSPS